MVSYETSNKIKKLENKKKNKSLNKLMNGTQSL